MRRSIVAKSWRMATHVFESSRSGKVHIAFSIGKAEGKNEPLGLKVRRNLHPRMGCPWIFRVQTRKEPRRPPQSPTRLYMAKTGGGSVTRPFIQCQDCGKKGTEWARGLCRPCYERGSSWRNAHEYREPVKPEELKDRRRFKKRFPTKHDPLGVNRA